MIEARGLAIGHTAATLLRGLDFRLAAGERLAVLGPNGAGKTTLLRTLLGLQPPHAGAVRLDGRALERMSRAEVARLAGYVPQAQPDAFAWRVLDLVLMGRTAHLGIFAAPTAADRSAAMAALETLGLGALAGRPCSALSGGERQAVLIARALAQQPRLLVLDEPTASLDLGNEARVLSLIDGLARDGLAIVLSTHAPDHALGHADRVLLLERTGPRLGTPAELLDDASLSALYGVALQRRPVPRPAA